MKPLLPRASKQLELLGERIRKARLRRKLTAEVISVRAGITRPTLQKIEAGDPTVAFGNYFHVLTALQLDADLEKIAADDELGRRLQDLELPERRGGPPKPRSRAAGRL